MNTEKLIDELGGPTALAKVCKIKPQAVTQWKQNGIPPARMMFLELKFPQIVKKYQGA